MGNLGRAWLANLGIWVDEEKARAWLWLKGSLLVLHFVLFEFWGLGDENVVWMLVNHS